MSVLTTNSEHIDCQKELEEFLSAARILGPKQLCCVLQFGFCLS